MAEVVIDEGNPTVIRLELEEFQPRDLVDAPEPVAEVPPVHVRSSTQLRAFAKHVANSPEGSSFGLLADPGLGKSTQFPLILAEIAKAVVILVEYCGSLADGSADGLIRAQTELSVCPSVPVARLKSGPNSIDLCSLKGPYVVVVSARILLARVASGRSFTPAIVLHDESHYCDYATFTWRMVSPRFSWITRRVAMSATISPSIKSDGTAIDCIAHGREEVALHIPPVKEWAFDVAPATAERPWVIDRLRGRNTLVFSDDQAANRAQARILTKNGFDAFVLTVVERPEYVKKVREISFRVAAGVVIFASSLYRNGYNFGVDTVIDCGSVREQYIDDGKVLERYRRANQTEILQAAARVGRSRGGVAYRPVGTFTATVPLLALGEVRHAAALHILAGFRPSPVLVELVGEVAEWTQDYAQAVVRSSLHNLLRGFAKKPVERREAKEVPPKDNAAVDDVPVGDVKGSAERSTVDLMSVLNRVRDFDMDNRHVDEVFTLTHPGARYSVPNPYSLAPTPYWVGAEDAQRMLRKLLRGDGRFDVMMLTEPELQWFATRLVTDWNMTAAAVVENSLMLSAAQDVIGGRCLLPNIVDRVRDTKRDTALHVRELEATMGLMRELYERRPFAVRAVDVSSEVRDSQIRSARGRIAEATYMPVAYESHGHRVPVERLISNVNVGKTNVYSWGTNRSVSRSNLLISSRTTGTSSKSSGSN